MAMAALAAVAAVISYSDGLFLVRLAGNRDWHAYLYPLLPDILIVVCLIALLAPAPRRPRWPAFGLGLGIALTLSMNVAAGIAHSPLDAVVDGFVPVVFFVAVEVFIGYVRRGRGSAPALGSPAASPASATASVAASAVPKLPSLREIQARQNCGQATAKKARAEVQLDRRDRGGAFPDPRAAAPVTMSAPAGEAQVPPPAPAGAQVRATLNGQAHGG